MLDLIGSSLTVSFLGVAGYLFFVLFKTALVVPDQQAVVVEAARQVPAVLFAGCHPHPFIDAVAYRRS